MEEVGRFILHHLHTNNGERIRTLRHGKNTCFIEDNILNIKCTEVGGLITCKKYLEKQLKKATCGI